MPNLPKRTIAEIIQLHKREGSRQQELFVEGAEDRRFYADFLKSQGLRHILVLDMSTVDVPAEEVKATGEKVGCRGRVIALAAALEGKVAINEVLCVADSDTDIILGRVHTYAVLLKTDFTSLELYALRESVFSRVQRSLNLEGLQWATALDELTTLLKEPFLMRVACELRSLSGTFPDDFSSYCLFEKATGKPYFRFDDYAARVVSETLGRTEAIQLMRFEVDRLSSTLSSEVRHHIHGHDFRSLVGWYFRHRSKTPVDRNTLSTLLMSFVPTEELLSAPLFQEILRRLRLQSAA